MSNGKNKQPTLRLPDGSALNPQALTNPHVALEFLDEATANMDLGGRRACSYANLAFRVLEDAL